MNGHPVGAVFASELIKLRSLRSTAITLGVTMALTIGFAPLTGWTARVAIDTENPALNPDFSATICGFEGLYDAVLGLIVFGVLAMSQEYASGMIRTSLMAVPRRALFLAAKMAAIALVSLAVAVPTTVCSFALTEHFLGGHGVSLLAPQVPRAILGGIAFLVLSCLLAAGLTAIVRSAVVSLVTLLPLFTFAPMILKAIGPLKDLTRFLPRDAGLRMMATGSHATEGLSPAAGGAVLALWTIAALFGGYLLLRTRTAECFGRHYPLE